MKRLERTVGTLAILALLLALSPVTHAGAPDPVEMAALQLYAPLSEAERAAVVEGLRTDSSEMAAFVAMRIVGSGPGASQKETDRAVFEQLRAHVEALSGLQAVLEGRAEAAPTAARPLILLGYALESYETTLQSATWNAMDLERLEICLQPEMSAAIARETLDAKVLTAWRQALARAEKHPNKGASDPDVRYAAQRLRELTTETAKQPPRSGRAERAAQRRKDMRDLRVGLAVLEADLAGHRPCDRAGEEVKFAEIVAEQARAVVAENDIEMAADLLPFMTDARNGLNCPPGADSRETPR